MPKFEAFPEFRHRKLSIVLGTNATGHAHRAHSVTLEDLRSQPGAMWRGRLSTRAVRPVQIALTWRRSASRTAPLTMCLEKPPAENRRERQLASGWGGFSEQAAMFESRASLAQAAMSTRLPMYGQISVGHRAEFQVDQCLLISRQQAIKRVDHVLSRSLCNVQSETLA